MEFRYTYTRLNVENFQACKLFYRDILGFEIGFEDAKDEYAEFKTGSAKITLFNRQNLRDFIPRESTLNYDAHSARIALSFEVHNLDEAIAYLKQNGVEILNMPTSYPDKGFMSSAFRDPDGNLIEIT